MKEITTNPIKTMHLSKLWVELDTDCTGFALIVVLFIHLMMAGVLIGLLRSMGTVPHLRNIFHSDNKRKTLNPSIYLKSPIKEKRG